MTYKDLIQQLRCFSDEQLNTNVTLEFNEEFFMAELKIADTDVLDSDHPVLGLIDDLRGKQ